MRILGISGSLRAGSYNTQALRAAQALVPDGSALDIATLHGLPLYNADVQAEGFPESVVSLADAISEADAVVIASPEYNFSVPGVLKNALDWLSRVDSKPFAKKPVAILGASTGRLGTARGQYHLRQVLLSIDAYTLGKPEVMISGAREAFDEIGDFADARTAEIVRTQLEALIDFAGVLARGNSTSA